MNDSEKRKQFYVECCVKGTITVAQAASKLGFSERYVWELKRRYKAGETSMLHGNCGKQPKKTLDVKLKQKILDIKALPEFAEVNFLHFQEILEEKYGIKVSYCFLLTLFKSQGIKSPKRHRKSGKKHPSRPRRKRFGEMLQGDGTPFDWFKTGETSALHALIDDATGEITGAYMTKNECYEGYSQCLQQTFKRYGVPESLYLDGLSMFFPKTPLEPTLEEQFEGKTERKTQFARVCDDFKIQMIHAHSSQAKGRVERLWGTLQSRLSVEFAMNNIKTIDAANKFLSKYIPRHNRRFGKKAASKTTAFTPVRPGIDYDTTFAIRHKRDVDRGGCFSLNSVIFQVDGLVSKKKVDVLISEKLGVKVMHEGKLLNVIPIKNAKKEEITSSSSMEMIISRFVFFYCLKNEHVA